MRYFTTNIIFESAIDVPNKFVRIELRHYNPVILGFGTNNVNRGGQFLAEAKV